MTTAEARTLILLRVGFGMPVGCNPNAEIDALIAAVRAEEREKIVKALREQGKKHAECSGPDFWTNAALFVAALEEGA